MPTISTTPQTLHIRLIDTFSMTYGAEPVASVNTPRLQSLLAYLVLHAGTPQPRQHIAFLYWPDSSDAQARNNLRQTLHALRLALPEADAFLNADTHTISWRSDAPFRLDVAEFAAALGRAAQAEQRGDGAARRRALEEALGLYRADLLLSCYDDWIAPERERIRQQYTQALDTLIWLAEEQRDYAAAIGYARRWVRENPLDEDGYRRLMELLAGQGDRAGALSTYHACANMLQREFGVEPGRAIYAVYLRLRQGGAPGTEPEATPEAEAHAVPSSPTAAPSLIGRQREWERLTEAWRRASTGQPSIALLTGEAGIGKSRLADDLLLWVNQQGGTTAKTRCYAAEGQLSLAPVTEWLRNDGLRRSLARVKPVWLAEVARILPELSGEYPDLPHYEPITEYGQRQRFFEALAQSVLAQAQPLLLLIDDLQWCDQETLEWLHFLLRFDAHARLLVVGSVRLEDTAPQHPLRSLLLDLHNTVEVCEIALQPLDAAESAKLAASVATRELSITSAMRLFRETEGNPLFIVEAMRAGFDPHQRDERDLGAREDDELARSAPLPPKVQAVIAARLGQLSAPARQVAALAATIGREFRLDVLTRAGNSDEDTIVGALDELWQRRIVRAQGTNTYDFTHDKLREVAYTEIGVPQRRLLHRRIAQALEALHGDNLDSVSGQLAAHYEHAGLARESIAYYQRAALVAQRLFAYEDAIRLLRHALALLEGIPGGTARDRQELGILLALAPLYRVTHGWTAPELERVVNRALALCDTVGGDAERAQVIYGLESMLVVQAQLGRVQLINEELHALYDHMGNEVPPFADMMLVGARLHLGRISEANDAFARILSTHNPQQTRHLQEEQGWNIAVHVRAWRAHALWCLGYPEQALSVARESTELARANGEPFNEALAATYSALLWQMAFGSATARAHAEEALALTTEYKVPYYRAWAAILVAHAQATEHPDEAHITAMWATISAFKDTGARIRLPYYLALLAEVYGQAGQPEEGLAIIEEGLAQARESRERWLDAELHRVRGELMLLAGRDRHDAEAAVRRAADIARSQQSRLLELRALVALCRMSEPAEATRHALHEVYAGFTEGFEMPDLQAARALLGPTPTA